jgi:hypothetical protein
MPSRLAFMLVLVVAAVALRAEPAGAAPVPVKTYCSPSGDVCFGILRRSGAIFLDLTTAAKYFQRYTLCVRPPRGAVTCRRFPMRSSGRGAFSSSVRWHSSFPARGAGTYRVTWRLQKPLGPPLSFALR